MDPAKEATLTIDFCPEDIPAADVKFELFKVADVDEYTNLTLTDSFAGLPLDLTAPDSSVWASAVEEAESLVSSNGLTADYSTKTNAAGKAVFSDLPVGLYLLRGDAFVQNHDVYRPQSYLIMLPGLDSNGEWEYDVISIPKFSKSDELIDLSVAKKWVGDSAGSRPESITVVLYCDDAEYESVVLSADNSWQYTWSDLNAKNKWTVSEVTVEGYSTTLENDGYSFVIINTMLPPPTTPTTSATTTASTAPTMPTTTTGKPSPTPPSDGKLPQTGLVWWHIPLLAATGIVLCLAGLLMVRKHSKEA